MDTSTFDHYVMSTYGRFPITLTRGSGCCVWDDLGKEYLDFVAGIAVCCLGHSSPVIQAAAIEQLSKLQHVSNLYYNEPQGALAKWLVENSCADKVFFCNSGAEANEAAFKLARKYGHTVRGIEEPIIVCALDSFHGRTIAGITATGQAKYKKNFGPLVPAFEHVPFNDFAALVAQIWRLDESGPRVAAVVLEPIQGEGGVTPIDPVYVANVREFCSKHGILLVFDEVQTGVGRTGTFWAYEQFGVEPDIFTTAKGIAGGLPMGALLAKEFCSVFAPGDHASTFGGSPLVSNVALAVCREVATMLETNWVKERGSELQTALNSLLEEFPGIFQEVRGLGLMCGLQISPESGLDSSRLIRAAMDAGLLLVSAGPMVVRFLPPLVVSKEEISLGISRLREVCNKLGPQI